MLGAGNRSLLSSGPFFERLGEASEMFLLCLGYYFAISRGYKLLLQSPEDN